MNQVLYLNGQFMPLDEGKIPITDRGYQFADGVYDVIRVYGGTMMSWREHLERLIYSLRKINIEPPMSLDEMAEICREVIRRSGENECSIYAQITRGVAARNHKYPASPPPPTVIFYNMPIVYHEEPVRRRGVKIMTHPDIRWKCCDIKSIALLPNVMLKNYAISQGCFEALLYDERGIVSECAICNASCIKDGTIYSAPDGPSVLPGITKLVLFQEARTAGIPVVEQAQSVEFFKSADEVFMSSCTMELMPVIAIDDTPIGKGEAGEITWRLHKMYQNRIARECGLDRPRCD